MMQGNKKKYTWFARQQHKESVDLEPTKRLTRTRSTYTLEEERGKFSTPKSPRNFGSTLNVPKKELPSSLEETDRDSIMPEQFRVPPNLAQLLLSESLDTENDNLTPLYNRLTINELTDHEAPKEEFNWEEEAATDSISSTRPPKEKYLRHSSDSMREYSEMKLTIDWNTDENTGPTGFSFGQFPINGSKTHGSRRESIDSTAATSERKLKSVTPDRSTQGSQTRSNQYSRIIYEDDSIDKGRSSVGGVRYVPESYYEPKEIDSRTKKSCNMRKNEPSSITSSLDPEFTTLPQDVPPIQVIPPGSSMSQISETQETLMSRSDASEIAPEPFVHHKCAQRKIYQEKSKEKFLNERKKRDTCVAQKDRYRYSSRMTQSFLEDYSPYKPEQIDEVSKLPENEIRSSDIAKSDPESRSPTPSSKRTKSRLQELYFDSKMFEEHQTSIVDPNFLTRNWDSTTKIHEGNKAWSRPSDKTKLPIPSLVSNQNFESKSQLQSSVYRDLYEDKYLNTQRDSAYKPPKKYYKTFLKRKNNTAKSTRNPTIQYPPIPSKLNLKFQKDTILGSLGSARFSQFRHTFNSSIYDSQRQTVASVGGQNRQESRLKKEPPEDEKQPDIKKHQDDEWQWPKEGTGNRKCRAFKNRKLK